MSLWTCTPVFARAAAVICIVTVTSVARAGDLNPPPGAITETMLRLDQIEPRRIVNDLPGAFNAVHVISTNGNYVVTAEVDPAGSGQHGILVTASEVTLDLNGFGLRGLPGSLDGIHVDTPTPSSFAAKGEVSNVNMPTKPSISGFDGNGVTVLNAAGVHLTTLRVSDCGGDGISVTTASAALEYIRVTMEKVLVTSCAGNGMDITLTPGPTADRPHVVTLTVTDTSNNTGHGVVIRGSGFPPPIPGEPLRGTAGVSMEEMSATGNGGDGVRFEFDNTIRPSITMRRCKANGNSGSGVNAVSLSTDTKWDHFIHDVDASFNGGNGLTVSGNLTVLRATSNNNAGDGIQYVAGTALRKRKISIEQMIGDSNGGNGASFAWPSKEYTMTVRNSSFTGNTLDGLSYRDLDSDDDGLCENVDVIANNNGGGGIVMLAPDAGTQCSYRDCSVTLNGGAGFDQVGGSARFVGCNASLNGDAGYKTVPATLHIGVYIMETSMASGNQGAGFNISGTGTFNGCSSINNGSHGYGVVGNSFFLDGSTSQGNAGDGFNFVADSVVMAGCAALDNLGDGCDFSAGGQVTLLAIKAGGFVDNGGHGINVLNARLSLSGSAISGNGMNGINAAGTRAGISHIEVYGNLSSGISASNSSLYCSNVTVTENLFGGVLLSDYGRLTMDWCTVDNNTGNGVTASSSLGVISGPVTMRRCSFAGNTGTGCSIASSIGGQFTECSAFNNGFLGIEVLSAGHVLTGNVAGANPSGNVVASLGNAVGPPVGASVIGADNNFANPNPSAP